MRVVVIGAGEVGYNIADTLSKEGNDIIIIDKEEERLKIVSDNLDVETVLGSGSSPRILQEAKLDQSEMVVAVTDSDETNIVACLIASTQSKVPFKIARIRAPDLTKDSIIFNKQFFDIDLCINPERESVNSVINLLEYSGASEVVDFAEGRVKLVAFPVNPECITIGKNLMAINKLYGDSFLVASITRQGESFVPNGKTVIENGDTIFFFAESTKLRDILRFFGKETKPAERIFVMGGGTTGLMLAELLEKKGMFTKIIEKRQDRCENLASVLNRAVVLHGDGTSQNLLKEENVRDADYFIAVTDDEEANILGALLAKQLGVKKTVSLVKRVDYSHLVSTVGIDSVMNPRHATVGAILHYIRKGKVISAMPLRDEKTEAVEFIALETSGIINKPLKDIKFPKGTIVGAVLRGGEVIIPWGDTIILPGDRVIIVTLHSAIRELEKILTVKLDYF
jgi:trk system potassium uptake protein TrkA